MEVEPPRLEDADDPHVVGKELGNDPPDPPSVREPKTEVCKRASQPLTLPRIRYQDGVFGGFVVRIGDKLRNPKVG